MSWPMKLFHAAKRLRRRRNVVPQIDLSLVHLPVFSGRDGDSCCVHCGKPDDDPIHLHPDMKIGPFVPPMNFAPLQGSLTRMAARVIEADPGAVLMEESVRFPFIVFVQLTNNDLLPKARRALWWEKPAGVLAVVLGVGEIQYTLEEQDEWLNGTL